MHLLRRSPIPPAAILLVAAAGAAQLVPSLGWLTPTTNQWIVTVALAVILFEGGMDIGLRRLRPVAIAVLWIGTMGTLVTAAALAFAAHAWFGFDWRPALLLGTALAPTDPAVVFSVLGGREIPGHSRTILEGESGANDPIGIALMISILSAHGATGAAVGKAIGEFALQLGVGMVIGVLAGVALHRAARALPAERLFPWLALAWAAPTFALAYLAHGSGFLAVFVAGIVVGDGHRGTVRRLTDRLSTAAEVVAFVVLGLSVSLSSVVHHNHVWTGVGLAALLIIVARPVLVGLLLWPIRLRAPERVFVLWAGLKGAVPILLGTLMLAHGHVTGSARVYDVIFVVVIISVVVQGGLVPFVARRVT